MEGSMAAGGGSDAHSVYLRALDKEMTIMGILSVFAVFAPAAILDKTVDASEHSVGSLLWAEQGAMILLASGASFMAALFFYRQRSDLAFWYGQIALSTTPSRYPTPSTAQLIHATDRWSAWRSYFFAFACTTLSALWYTVALVAYLMPSWRPAWTLGAAITAFATVAAVWGFRQIVFECYDETYSPWPFFWREHWSERWGRLRRWRQSTTWSGLSALDRMDS